MRVFIVGPGGVGKTTSGKILAKRLGFEFVDLDLEFMKQVRNIDEYVAKFGYEKYCYANSELFERLLNEYENNVVMPLSSGFLVHEGLNDLVDKHIKLLKSNGISILLLPSRDIIKAASIVVERQINRGFGEVKEGYQEKAKQKYCSRHERYKCLGDIQIYSLESPEQIADKMVNSLQRLVLRK
ncbi:MAG: hypothetical protein UT34_C0002G0329 [candidate division WS6 bacterium GW2011_GWF2_39_15]|uniref:Shikimate kinase n=1 Tax=candidate division WS6 bacterium GW2011_GWF2_39_15 TaxID=1619100 RepID=A0A0G0QW13_9BACT|nr:MAG: hypothetical protein UT34_C0002G0329 [candidate division WS6 bacterium GW2011_GWF2_39_15]